MANSWVGSGHLDCGPKKKVILNGLKTGRVNRVAGWVGSGWPIFFTLTKILIIINANFLEKNDSNQIVSLFVTNLLLYVWCERKKIDKPRNIKISISLQFKQFWLLSMTKILYILQIQSSLMISFSQKNLNNNNYKTKCYGPCQVISLLKCTNPCYI